MSPCKPSYWKVAGVSRRFESLEEATKLAVGPTGKREVRAFDAWHRDITSQLAAQAATAPRVPFGMQSRVRP